MLIITIFLLALNTSADRAHMYGYRAPLENKIDHRCYAEDYTRAWVYFTDKGVTNNGYEKMIASVAEHLSPRSLARRQQRGGIIDYGDVPLYDDFLQEVEARGGLLVRKSRWLNAASFIIHRDDLQTIARLPFVHRIVPIVLYQGKPIETEQTRLDSTIFGLTYNQLHMFNIDALHELGYFGSNIKIGILDTGLRKKHVALDGLRLMAEHDFMDGDRIYMDNVPITVEPHGVIADIVFKQTSSRLNVFFSGDTVGQYNLKPSREIMYTYSDDGGATWLEPPERVTSAYRHWTRELDMCGNDTMFVLFRDAYGLKYLVYADSLLVGSMPLWVGKEPSCVQVNDTVYAAFQDTNAQRLMLVKGTVNGFGTPVRIDSAAFKVKAPRIIASNDALGVFYHTLPGDSLYFAKSPLPVDTFPRQYFAHGKDAEAISSGDTVFVIWKDMSESPLTKIAFSKSYDFGGSFTTPLDISQTFNAIGKISLARLDAQISVVWESAGKIYKTVSYDNGDHFLPTDSLPREFTYLATAGTVTGDIATFYCERGDSITDGYAPDDPEYLYPHHGTKMLSAIAGYMQDNYVGVAPAAEIYVAKTEIPGDSVYEFPVEEDTWIAGLEWFESQGVDVVNSSLGYTDWYDFPEDYDGSTSPASIAANEAARRGMIIVNASGNLDNPSIPQIHIPGDAQEVITVGGIDTLLYRWVNSGYYPTTDHSPKKPELVCLADAPIVVDPDSINSYVYSRGTSGATAMISGLCALLLEGHPSWNVDSLKAALTGTASHADAPTDSLGYGWPDALAAMFWQDTIPEPSDGTAFLTPYPNPFIISQHQVVYVPFKLEQSYTVELRLYSINGRHIKTDSRDNIRPGIYDATDPDSPNAAFIWDGTDDEGEEVASGIYYCTLLTRGGTTAVTKIAVVK
jgi:hypothetical protein